LGGHATPIFDAAVNGQTITFFEAWAGALAYTFQLYFDFSGYSDMAIGLGRMYGITIPLNFNLPYQASSIIEFWRRWHVTLSRFLRDYLYIPLGGNRKGRVRRYINLMITMLLGGFWHGAGWTFVVWGGLHGLYLIMNHAWRFLVQRMGFRGNKGNVLTRFVGWFLTFTAVVVAWVLFRAENFRVAMEILRGMAGLNGFVLPTQVMNLIPFNFIKHFIHSQGTVPLLGGGVMGFFVLGSYLAVSFLVCMLLPSMHTMSARWKLALTLLTFAFVVQRLFFSAAPSEFLYFQF